MQKLGTVLLDIDGVLCNYVDKAVQMHLQRYPNDMISSISEWTFPNSFLHKEEMIDMLLNEAEEIMTNALPYADAYYGYSLLCRDFNVKIVTARGLRENNQEYIMQLTNKWLFDNAFILHDVPLYSTHNKHEVKGDILIDDSTEYLRKASLTNKYAIALNRPWNQDFYGPRGNTLEDIHQLCCKYIEQHN